MASSLPESGPKPPRNEPGTKRSTRRATMTRARTTAISRSSRRADVRDCSGVVFVDPREDQCEGEAQCEKANHSTWNPVGRSKNLAQVLRYLNGKPCGAKVDRSNADHVAFLKSRPEVLGVSHNRPATFIAITGKLEILS